MRGLNRHWGSTSPSQELPEQRSFEAGVLPRKSTELSCRVSVTSGGDNSCRRRAIRHTSRRGTSCDTPWLCETPEGRSRRRTVFYRRHDFRVALRSPVRTLGLEEAHLRALHARTF